MVTFLLTLLLIVALICAICFVIYHYLPLDQNLKHLIILILVIIILYIFVSGGYLHIPQTVR